MCDGSAVEAPWIRGRCLLRFGDESSTRRGRVVTKTRTGARWEETWGPLGLGFGTGLGHWFWVSRRESGVVVARPGTEGGVESKCLAASHLQLVLAAEGLLSGLIGWLGPVTAGVVLYSKCCWFYLGSVVGNNYY